MTVPPPSSPPPPPLHVILFPFMSKGHTIPLLHFVRLLRQHRPTATLTLFTTPANLPFISDRLSSTDTTVIPLPFPTTPEIPPGVESTDHLPPLSLFLPFVSATSLLQPHFESHLDRLTTSVAAPTTVLVSDGFLHWTQESVAKYNIPRLAFYGMSNYAATLNCVMVRTGFLNGPQGDDETVQVPQFPWIKLTRNDYGEPFNMREPQGPLFDFIVKTGIATSLSEGIIVNSFYELEPSFVDYWNKNVWPKAWCVGPLCLAHVSRKDELLDRLDRPNRPIWVEWLAQMQAQKRDVLYVAFGSQAELTSEQNREIAIGLEKSKVCFLWVSRPKPNRPNDDEERFFDEFDERIKDRGLVVREWVDQREVLEHETVKGFLSHCGWNSILESICAGVPILAWPVMAEQHLNARMVAEEVKVGLRVETVDGSVRGFVRAEAVEKAVKEIMEGKTGKEARKRVKELGEAARKAVERGGSSWENLESLLNELHFKRAGNHENVYSQMSRR